MSELDKALEYIFDDSTPDGTYVQEALETYKKLQRRKKLRDKKHRQDYRIFKREMIRKSTRKKDKNRYSYGKAI